MALGGLGAAMFSSSSPLWSIHMALRKVDIQSMFLASMIVIVLVVLAYLTNPSETSFRTYLTEQSFRQHLRRLDDDNADESDDDEGSGVHYTLTRRNTTTSSALHKPGRAYSDSGSPFHFVNRASVSLRTPKHVFHSFAVFTIAAIVPNGTRSPIIKSADGPGSFVSDSWYIGAFGRWWRGGYTQHWWLDPIANTNDAESCNSGILDLKTLDSLECYDGLPYSVPALPPHLAKESTSKVRDSARTGHRTANSSGRSSTPPPLPKSASLPLHAPPPSAPPTQGDKSVIVQRNSPPTVQQSLVIPSVVTANATLSPGPQLQHSPSAVFDQSPVISDILRKIAASKTAVHDLRAQLSDFKSSAAESHSSIQNDLETNRERKRTEDAARNELKSRTKTLDDSKRSAEAVKREAEKKLKAAESARTNASERIERLDKEINKLRERMSEDERAIEDLVVHSDEKEGEFQKELELKRKEIKVAEDVVAALNTRAKELEEKIAEEEERLKHAKEQAELRRQDRDFYPLHVVHSQEASPTMSPWSPISASEDNLPSQDPHATIHTDRSEHIEVFPQAQILQLPPPVPHIGTRSRGSSGSSGIAGPTDFSSAISPRPRKLSLSVISNFREYPRAVVNPEPPSNNALVNTMPSSQIPIRPPNSFPLFDDALTGPVPSTRFAPFGDNELEVPPTGLHDIGAPSPKSTSLIPTSLIQSLEGSGSIEDVSRSFKSDSDDFLERDWRTGQSYPLHGAPVAVESPAGFSSSPTSLNHPGFDGIDHEDPFEIRPPPPLRHRLSAADSMDLHNAQLFPHPNRTSSDPQPLMRSRTRESDESNIGGNGTGHRRWFSSSPKDINKEKKGLNPEAKVFQLKKPSIPVMRNPAPKYDTLPPMSAQIPIPPHTNGSSTALPLPPPVRSTAPGSFMDSFLSTLSSRAFAPSPAEREALTRALGSSTNTSLERLPTLSEVAITSMPASPSHVHAHAHAHAHSLTHGAPTPTHVHNVAVGSGRPVSSISGLAWLQNLPRMRKSKFSPWEDEEPSSSGNGHASF
ncbi:hypothetical protein QCA50_004086 [Cerrena zonata]|uniref:Uncharacterized protein n=1 Tax=Cerrena zonata TaxID=2478898 RepID=A0AAW0GSC8_9APHY